MIKLTITSEVLKEDVDKQIKELSEQSLDLEYYKELGINVSDNADSTIDSLLDDKDSYEKEENVCYVSPLDIDLIVDRDAELDTEIFLKSGKHLSVKESAEEVVNLIKLYKNGE